jgi:hypothetical protein
MAAEPEPFDDLAADAQRVRDAVGTWAVNVARERLPRSLVTLLSASLVTSAVAVIVHPAAVGVACACVVLAAAVYAYYARRRMHGERRSRAWAFIAGKRLQRDLLEREVWLDELLLAFAGHPNDRAARHGLRPSEAAKVLALVEHRIREAAKPEGVRDPRARRRQSAAASRPEPDLPKIRRRIERRKAEIAALDAEREHLAVPEDPAAEVEAAETRDRAREVRKAALAADREARDLRRRGSRATGRGGTKSLRVRFDPGSGHNDVSRGSYKPSPEEIADPDFEPPDPEG